MTADTFAFDRFVLDPADRTLRRDGARVELNARYLDALALLVAAEGSLVTKDRFLAEAWRGVPVTDEALTQCVRTLRRVLGDDAARPRFIETVPKHGYRFIAAVDRSPATIAAAAPDGAAPVARWRTAAAQAGAGTLGAGVAGVVGGLFYGSMLAAHPAGPGSGADVGGVSVLLVLTWLTIVAAVVGGFGVSVGIAAGRLAQARGWQVAGGALGGFVVGGVTKLLGIDAFDLLLGHAPGAIAGAPEGIGLGATVGVAAWLADRLGPAASVRRRAAIAAAAGAVGGVVIPAGGGTLMGGSLAALAHAFPASRLDFAALGGMVGEPGFGTIVRYVTGIGEGALFAGGIVGAMALATRR